MTDIETRIRVGGIFHQSLLEREQALDSMGAVVNITVSRKRLSAIQSKMSTAVMARQGTNDEYTRLLDAGNNLANILMPNHIDSILKEVLTQGQYEKALKANQEGKTFAFIPSGQKSVKA